jgi:hypothetical protein
MFTHNSSQKKCSPIPHVSHSCMSDLTTMGHKMPLPLFQFCLLLALCLQIDLMIICCLRCPELSSEHWWEHLHPYKQRRICYHYINSQCMFNITLLYLHLLDNLETYMNFSRQLITLRFTSAYIDITHHLLTSFSFFSNICFILLYLLIFL